jgi:hypothetical protein
LLKPSLQRQLLLPPLQAYRLLPPQQDHQVETVTWEVVNCQQAQQQQQLQEDLIRLDLVSATAAPGWSPTTPLHQCSVTVTQASHLLAAP